MNEFAFVGKQFEFDNNFVDKPMQIGNILLYQVGELACIGDYSFLPHKQICHEISYVISGRGKMATDNHVVNVLEGDIHIVGKGQIHELQSDPSDPLRYAYLAFDFVDANNDELSSGINYFFQNPGLFVKKDRLNLNLSFTSLINEFYHEGVFSTELLLSYIKQILILTYRNFNDFNDKVFLHETSAKSAGEIVYSIIRYIENHLYDSFTIKDISRELGYSYGHISYSFRAKTGKTLQSYITVRKMTEAVRLMKEGRLNITQIAEKLNYETIQSFSKVFTKTMGCAPSVYLKQFK